MRGNEWENACQDAARYSEATGRPMAVVSSLGFDNTGQPGLQGWIPGQFGTIAASHARAENVCAVFENGRRVSS